jgi:penicillin-binding protein 1C
MRKILSYTKKFKAHMIYRMLGVMLLIFYFSIPDKLFNSPTSTVVEDVDGELLMAHIALDGQWRFPLVDSIPNKYEEALLLFEDRRYYRHFGVSAVSILRAMKQNLSSGKIVSGGSSITMQVIRMSRQRTGRSIKDKIIEIWMALRLEFRYTKEEILLMYASNAPFGGNVVGLDAASWRYFGHSPTRLTWSEAALLAILPNAPSLIHPGKNRKALVTKRNRLLTRLHAKGKIDAATLQAAKMEELPGKPRAIPQITPHYMHKLMADGLSGKRIVTSIHAELQKSVNQVVKHGYRKNSARLINNMASIVIDVETNEILAYVGNTPCTDEEGKHVDVAIAPRSTGSILKPLLYVNAMQNGKITPDMLLPDYPTRINGYSPENYEDSYDGMVPASEALARSLNIPAVRLLSEYGVNRFKTDLERSGLTTLFRPAEDYGLSLILGGAEASLLELARAYAQLSRIAKGEVNQNGLSPSVAYEILKAMTNVNRPAEEQYWTRFEHKRKIAWKTGTSFGARDAWAIGVTDKYVVAVWAGNASGEGISGMTGSNTAAPAMFQIFQLLPSTKWFKEPNRFMRFVPICKESGHRAGMHCKNKVDQWLPTPCLRSEACTYHQKINIVKKDKAIFRGYHSCSKDANLKSISWFVLPTAAEHFYKNNHPTYKSLPPLLPSCSSEEKGITILYPMAKSVIKIPRLLDGSVGESVFEAVHQQKDEELFWYVDNRFITTTKAIHQLPIQPKPGKHLLVVTDSRGNSVKQYFRVEESGSKT